MKKVLCLASAAVLISALGATAIAQDPKSAPMFPPAGKIIPLEIKIVVSRSQDEKKISSLPYTMMVNANDGAITPDGRFDPFNWARLRTGASVPIPSMAQSKESPLQGPFGPVQYKQIGTNIDCAAHSTEDGKFKVEISIEDTSVYSDGQTAQGVPKFNDIPSFRTFQWSNTIILKDGQTSRFTAAADRISGEMTRVDVTLTVVKP